ncbi:hypothetical protein SHKM778_66900 [Streptomyces sp. KM77-8]|uniref:Uncharacterized protein n=1 Tax=Streptomyces haneummycinicus TaxID=3074435 RepID=A0AAT9HS63_9ACTN
MPDLLQGQLLRPDRDARQRDERQEHEGGEQSEGAYRPAARGRGGGLRALFWGLSTNTWLG